MERYDSTHAARKFRAANKLTSSARVFELSFVNLNPVIMIKQIPRRFDEALRMWGGFLLFIPQNRLTCLTKNCALKEIFKADQT